MNLTKHFLKIESERFAARVNVANSLSVFLDALSEDPAFISLIEHIRENYPITLRILLRIKRLAGLEIDYRYANPYDSALAAYAWAIQTLDMPETASIAAELLLSARQTWWARKIASLIINESPESERTKKAEHTSNNVIKFLWKEDEERVTPSGSYGYQPDVLSALIRHAEFQVIGKSILVRPLPEILLSSKPVDWDEAPKKPVAIVMSIPKKQPADLDVTW